MYVLTDVSEYHTASTYNVAYIERVGVIEALLFVS